MMNGHQRNSTDDEQQIDDNRPSPINFEEYVPWACKMMQVEFEFEVIIKKQVLLEAPSLAARGKGKKGRSVLRMSAAVSTSLLKTPALKAQSVLSHTAHIDDATPVVIDAIYVGENLTHIRFRKENEKVPCEIIKIISIILQFHPQVTKFSMGNGLNATILYEITNMMSISNITEIILDDCFFPESNYYLILDDPANLMHLSLARCNLTDVVVETLASRLAHPLPASKCLSALNLSSNFITDVGAGYLAFALRTNRKLKYLNLANNSITDEGAGCILDSLKEFPITLEENISTSAKYISYLKNKNDLVNQYMEEMKATATSKSKSLKMDKKKLQQQQQQLKGESCYERVFYGKAESMARIMCGEFDEPLRRSDAVSKGGKLYALGNNILCYLNLSYNQLSYLTLLKAIEVLDHQNSINMVPVGLLTLRLDGNPMPICCKELEDIQEVLEFRLLNKVSSRSQAKRRAMSVGNRNKN